MSRMLRFACPALLALGLAVPAAASGSPQPGTRSETVMLPMADSVRLATDVHLPGAGSFPVVLLRTPYDRRQFDSWLIAALVKHGYAVVAQDVRGMGGSQGNFIPFLFEKQDGLATLDWLASQAWCDGRVGMWGPSYVGFCAMVLAPEGHASLKTIVNLSGWSDSDAMVNPGGALQLMMSLAWVFSAQISGDTAARSIDWPAAFRHLPVLDIPTSVGLPARSWLGTARLIETGALRERASIAKAYDRVGIPILHVTGWYDFISPCVLRAYSAITQPRASAGSAGAGQALVVGPWVHDQFWTSRTRVGEIDFGARSSMGVDSMLALTIRWFDRHLRGETPPPSSGVRLFVMGENAWHDFERWPPPQATRQRWFTGSRKGANGLSGDGVLRAGAARPGQDQFRYDPNDPVPTHGGANSHFYPKNVGVLDQRAIEERRDVLVYTSAPLERPMSIIGPVQAVVHAATGGRHIDMTAKLVAVRPDGYAAILADGIRHGPDPVDGAAVQAMEPGRPYRFTIDLGGTAIRLERGHRIRLEISSGNFPKYIRNPGNGENPFTAGALTATEQTVFHGGERPTEVVLHVME